MNNRSIAWSIHGYQNEPTWQPFVSIYDGVGQRKFTIVKVHFSFDGGSIVISESSTCSKEAYDYATPQIFCTTLKLQRKHNNGDPISRKPLLKRYKALYRHNHD